MGGMAKTSWDSTTRSASLPGVMEPFTCSSPEAWRAMTLDEQRAHHEDFARGFESYLFEGKAPSIELQGVFQRFRAWLSRNGRQTAIIGAAVLGSLVIVRGIVGLA